MMSPELLARSRIKGSANRFDHEGAQECAIEAPVTWGQREHASLPSLGPSDLTISLLCREQRAWSCNIRLGTLAMSYHVSLSSLAEIEPTRADYLQAMRLDLDTGSISVNDGGASLIISPAQCLQGGHDHLWLCESLRRCLPVGALPRAGQLRRLGA